MVEVLGELRKEITMVDQNVACCHGNKPLLIFGILSHFSAWKRLFCYQFHQLIALKRNNIFWNQVYHDKMESYRWQWYIKFVFVYWFYDDNMPGNTDSFDKVKNWIFYPKFKMLYHNCLQDLDNVHIGSKRGDLAPLISDKNSLGNSIGQPQCCQKICHFEKFANFGIPQFLEVLIISNIFYYYFGLEI